MENPDENPGITREDATYGRVEEIFSKLSAEKGGQVTLKDLFEQRKMILEQIEARIGRPVIAYYTRTYNVPQNADVSIDMGDIEGFSDLVDTTPGDKIAVIINSNGGTAEATERIVNLIRDSYSDVHFIVPHTAYSAATLMCFSANLILMDNRSTLGPIDPQINGIPACVIREAFIKARDFIIEKGPSALPPYMPLLQKYSLDLLEMCETAIEHSKELAGLWLSERMFKEETNKERLLAIVNYFSDFQTHKSHGRPITIQKAMSVGLKIQDLRETPELRNLLWALHNHYMFFFKTAFTKIFENIRGINWGRQTVQTPIQDPSPMPEIAPEKHP